MAHNIGHMFYVGDVPWHKLGTRLSVPATLENALKAGALDWEVALEPLVLANSGVSVPHRMAVVRRDRTPREAGYVLGAVHPAFRPLQNREGMELLDELLGKGKDHYTTGGYLKSGEVVWLQAKLPRRLRVSKDDELETYLLFSNSHDGSYAIDFRITTVRVVCNNTLNIALRGKDRTQFLRMGHSYKPAIVGALAAEFLAAVELSCSEAEALFVRLASKTCAKADFKIFLDKLMPLPTAPRSSAKEIVAGYETRTEKLLASRNEIERSFDQGYLNSLTGRAQGPAEPNWWGALNALTGWVDHVQQVEGDKYAHAVLGAGNQLKAKALTQIDQMVQTLP